MFGFTPIDNFDRYIEQRLQDFFDEPTNNNQRQVSRKANTSRALPQLALDVQETDKTYVIHADLPGISKDAVSVHLEDNILTVETERKDQREENKGTVHLSERFYGKMKRSIRLPQPVDANKTEAKLENGVLTLQVAKAEIQDKRKNIAVL
ncbi:Alpha crystallin/Hsp20 domain-containing protein [Rozella allomycis CSF55]|uniref:Alpha crystallin/Hsp20 domain-containing protein n=1 Tax=Rozella allomycis (strain CSF55) TaxID=988480 RepID=A0A075B1R3_ROZAC|nr:Alpha crystallin/Hsp20 domain-containing protein [Rozella allomycis CSF55]|eukprot:EPZ34728.1 Alpha crystallin/Hsp20 domain-containing protein [Rozella allomycis CSF55]